ncbi:putative prostaglandin-E synthase [Helianthus annuus]|nr:putative prostaglandin-E synthase [Helianthus annuus]
MASTMRKLNRLAATTRAAASFSSTTTTTTVRRHSIIQTASYKSTMSNTFSYTPQSHWLPSHNRVTGGRSCAGCNRTFSTAATAARDLDEKELPQSNKSYVPNDVVLYQYQACPFCNKVKAFLEYYDIPYKIVEVNPMNKKEIKWSDYRKVPILMVDGEQMVNSSDIIDKMYQRMHPDSVTEDAETQKWRRWVDDHLVHVLSPNIYRSPSEALESFDYITTKGNFSFTERLVAKYGGAAAMYFVSKKLKKRHNITDERAALYEAADTWVNALNGRQYLGGSEPNLADLSVFGVLRPIRELKSGKDMVENTRIGEWFMRMESQMKPHRDTALQGS